MTGQVRKVTKTMTIHDFADVLHVWALDAWQVESADMTACDKAIDLPLAAALEGPQASRRMFMPQVDPYAEAEKQGSAFHVARAEDVGIDLVRLSVMTPFGKLDVVDTASFTVFALPPEAQIAGGILSSSRPVEFQAPDAHGWRSTAPDLRVQSMQRWEDRIDLISHENTQLVLLYKVTQSSVVFTPSAHWFATVERSL